MKANELRIGNLVLSKNMPVEIEEISIKTVTYCFGTFTLDYIEPIPFTEEWLLTFGFEKEDKYVIIDDKCHDYRVYNLSNLWYNTARKLWWYNHEKLIDAKIDYVHQLQNLYFALTNEELICDNGQMKN
jgi:hypothetical protein